MPASLLTFYIIYIIDIYNIYPIYIKIIYIIQSRYVVVSNARFHHQYHLDFVKQLINVYLLKKVYIMNGGFYHIV